MLFHAGLDRSGTPHLTSAQASNNLYVVCLAAVMDRDGVGSSLGALRPQFGMSSRAEFRGHQSSERMQVAVLAAAMDAGLRVGALLIDKEATRRQSETTDLPAPADFQILAAVALLEQFIPRYSLQALWCDEDIKGKERQKEFVTAVKRLHRANWPEMHLKVRHSASDSSDLVQLADVTAYGLSRLSRAEVASSELTYCLEAIREDPQNVIIGPMAWEVGENC